MPKVSNSKNRLGRLAWRPLELSTSKKVEMEVGNGFATVGAVVDDDAEAIFGVALLAGNVANLKEEVPEKVLVILLGEGNTGERLFGNEEEMNGRLGRDVAEAEALVIFVNNVGGNFTGDDFFEEGGWLAH